MVRDRLRGQLSLEFLIVFTGLLIIVAMTTLPLYDKAYAAAEKVTTISDAREAANTLANAVNTVYANGPGSKLIVEYWLPKGVVDVYLGGYENLDVDGLDTTDENVSKNGRADIQILLDLDGDDSWDNKREAVVLVDTLLPSRYYENGDDRGDDWVNENGVHVSGIRAGGGYTLTQRTLHRTIFEYYYNPGFTYHRRIIATDEILESV